MQTKSFIRKWLVLTVVVLFVGISITALGESSEAIATKKKATIGLHDSSRDQIELRYYDPNMLTNVVGMICPMPFVWQEAIRLTQTELAPYSTWNLTKVVIGFGEDPEEGPMNVTIFIYDTGNSTHPGNVIVNDTWAVLNGTALITVPLKTPVSLAGHTELWVAVQWTQHNDLAHYAYVDNGPAVRGKGDWAYYNDGSDWLWQEIYYQLDANWALGAVVEGQGLTTLAITKVKGPLGIMAIIQNTGNYDAKNVSWSIQVTGFWTLNGLLIRFFNTSAANTTPLLTAHQRLKIRLPLFIGFGSIQIIITAHAIIAPEVTVRKSAFSLGPFVFAVR